MKITDVKAIPVWASFEEALGGKVPDELARPAFGMRKTVLQGQGAVIVVLTTDEGLVGIGESMGRPGPLGSAGYINEVLAPILIGEDPRHIEVLWHAMNEEIRFAPMGISGVDMALWDIRGKIYGDSLVNMLGGASHEKVDCYASPIPFMATPDDSAKKAQEFIQQGFHALKLKIGRGIATDLSHVEAVRDMVGKDTKILVDANGAYTVSESIKLAQGLVKLDVFWLEEPVHPEYADDLARVRRRVDLPIVSGEWLGTVYQFRDLIKAEAVDVIMPNITRCGGVTGMQKVAQFAALENVKVAPHGVGLGVGIMASISVCATLYNFLIYEYNQLFNPLRHTVMQESIDFRDGFLSPNQRDGLGLTLNDETIKKYTMD
jgi:L-alanine-DL-glutamate epimerase-like enolase superfamily enzyme